MANARVMSPSRSEIATLRTPLTAGELEVLNFFDSLLAIEWEIYVQPFLNGLRPDFVLLNPRAGVAVFEVKDWAITTGAYRSTSAGFTVTGEAGTTANKQSPRKQVGRYQKEIANLYSPQIGTGPDIAAITAGTIFTQATTEQTKQFLSISEPGSDSTADQYLPVAGSDALESGDIGTVFPGAKWRSSKIMTNEAAESLRRWLVEPRIPRERRVPIRLDTRQRELAFTRTETGYRRIRGPAGSGKSLVLAQRAAALSNEGKDVLFLTFNHTLVNYVGDLIAQSGGKRNSVVRLNFHAWAKRTFLELGEDDSYNAQWASGRERRAFPDTELASALLQHLRAKASPGEPQTYDAVLVDEGQDWLPEWWFCLREIIRPGGEMLLAADFDQDIYDRSGRWDAVAMIGAGFLGPWSDLTKSYRMSPRLTGLMKDFQSRFIPPGELSGPDKTVSTPPQTAIDTNFLQWVQTTEAGLDSAVVAATNELLARYAQLDIGASDLCIIVDRNETGMRMVKHLESRSLRVAHTFDSDERKSRQLKRGFYQESGRISVTTVQSFKGWEAPAIVAVITNADHRQTYTALTRLAGQSDGRGMIAVSTVPEYAEWGQTWAPPSPATSTVN